MRTGYYKQAAPRTRRQVRTEVGMDVPTKRLSCVECVRKDTEESSITQEPQLFDAAGNPSSDNAEMAAFFDAVRPHLEGLKSSDRLSVLSCLYWARSGEDRETLAALLRKPLRPVFEAISDKMKI